MIAPLIESEAEEMFNKIGLTGNQVECQGKEFRVVDYVLENGTVCLTLREI